MKRIVFGGFCLALYGFALGLQALGDGTEKQEDN